MSMSLDIICSCYEVEELKLQAKFYDKYKLNYPYYFVNNFTDQNTVIKVNNEIKHPIYWVGPSPGKHLGAYTTAAMAGSLSTNENILHYHADMDFTDINDIETMFQEFIASGKSLAGIPRYWMFDNDGNLKDKTSLPVRSEFFFIKSSLYKKIFNLSNYNVISKKCIENGHPSLHFEPIITAGLELLGIDVSTDTHYLEDVKQMKSKYGDDIIYYETRFEKTGLLRLK